MQRRRHASLMLVAALVVPLLVTASHAAPTDAQDTHVSLNAKELRWVPGPPSMPPGARIAVLHGNPAGAGTFVMRIKTPAGYKWPAHWHSRPQTMVVLSGAAYLGYGERWNGRTSEVMRAGAFHYLPGSTHQHLYTKAATVFEVQGEGPYDVNYVNPEDDPQKWAQGKMFYFPSQFELHAQPPGDLPAQF